MLVCVLSKLGNTKSDWYTQLRSWICDRAIAVYDVKKLKILTHLYKLMLYNNEGTVETVCEEFLTSSLPRDDEMQ